MGRNVKDTTWELTLKRMGDEGVEMKVETITVDSSWPDKSDTEVLEVDGWHISVMTLKDTNYE